MRILYDNKADNAALSASTANANYPLSAIQERHLSRTFRTTSATSQTITFDLGSAVALKCISILGHNLTTSATITLSGNSSDSWASPPFTTTITAVTRDIVHYFTESTYQYWQLAISDASLSYIEIGRVFMGSYLQVTKPFINEYTEDYDENTVQNYSRGGQVYASKGVKIRQYQLTFPYFANAMVQSFKTMLDDVGAHTSLIADLDENNQDKLEPLYGIFEPGWSFSHIFNNAMSLQIGIREVK